MVRVLVACEFSGIVRDAFRKRGHDAWSCDLLPTDSDPRFHIKGDIFEHLEVKAGTYDLMIAHPPCTYLANSGVCWLYKKKGRWGDMAKGAMFFRNLLDAKIGMIAVENPVPHKYAVKIIGRKYDQIIQPYMFGHPERKATCLWLKNLPRLVPTNDVRAQMLALPKNKAQRIHYLPPTKDRWKLRSLTFTGIAEAMAKQWGNSK